MSARTPLTRRTAVFTKEREGGYSVTVPELPGCFSEGDTFEEAQRNVRDAIRLYMKDEPKLAAPRESVVATLDLALE